MKINYRQCSILVFMSFIALKFLALPSVMYKVSGNMTWLVTLVLMLIDAIYAFIIMELIRRNQDKNLYDFMKNTLGVVLSKIILIVLLLKYVIAIGHVVIGLGFFVIENFYTQFSWYLYALPMALVVGYMVYKGIRNIARVCELLYLAIVVGCIYIAIKPIMSVDPLVFLPFFKEGAGALFQTGYMHISWFGSSTFLIILFGDIDFKNEKKSQLIRYMALGIILVQLLYFVFVGLFDITCPTHNFAISDISQFASGRSTIDELSWLVVSLWVVAQVIQIAMYCYCLKKSIKYLFNIKNDVLPVILIDSAIVLWVFMGEKFIGVENVFFSNFASIITIIGQYVIPIILWIGYGMRERHKKRIGGKYEKVENNI